MNTKRCAGALALAAAVVLSSSFWRPAVSAQSAQPPLNGPQFEVDPSWPKQLPERWVTGELGGVCVDANDHVFVLSSRIEHTAPVRDLVVIDQPRFVASDRN